VGMARKRQQQPNLDKTNRIGYTPPQIGSKALAGLASFLWRHSLRGRASATGAGTAVIGRGVRETPKPWTQASSVLQRKTDMACHQAPSLGRSRAAAQSLAVFHDLQAVPGQGCCPIRPLAQMQHNASPAAPAGAAPVARSAKFPMA